MKKIKTKEQFIEQHIHEYLKSWVDAVGQRNVLYQLSMMSDKEHSVHRETMINDAEIVFSKFEKTLGINYKLIKYKDIYDHTHQIVIDLTYKLVASIEEIIPVSGDTSSIEDLSNDDNYYHVLVNNDIVSIHHPNDGRTFVLGKILNVHSLETIEEYRENVKNWEIKTL